MTRDEFTNRLPKLTDDPLPLKPPFEFNGLSANVFPLRASLDALQELTNGYLNIVPPEAGRFRPVGPYVYLMILDYGQLTEKISQIGWFAQVEVFFGVPVEWYKLVNGSWVFHGWAIFTPYIFVDDEMSVPLGRSLYGFPKALAKVTRASSDWIKNSQSPVTLVQLETAVFPEAYAGQKLQTRVFLEVQRAAPMSNFRAPFSFTTPMAPWTIASNIADALSGLGRDAMWMAQAMRIFPLDPSNYPGILQGMAQNIGAALPPWGPGFMQHSLNLKQFRRSDDPKHLCYQSLTDGQMLLGSFNGGGLLGEDRTMLGDLTGGYNIRLYEHSSLPIVRTLGLEVSIEFRGSDVDVANIKPVLPFWANLNVHYQQAENAAWRSHEGIWRDAGGNAFDPFQKPADKDNAPLFDVTVASAIEAVSGPFQFFGATVRVMPLRADAAKLQTFLDSYINSAFTGADNPVMRDDGQGEEHIRLTVWSRPPVKMDDGAFLTGGAYVYLAASSYDVVTSTTNNVGDWAKYELVFLVPVHFERQSKDGTWHTVGVGVVPAFHMVDTCIAAISRTEIQGIPSSVANFVRPESVWLGETVDGRFYIDPEQTLLRVDAEVFPATEAGQETSIHPVIEIMRRNPTHGLGPNPEQTAWLWAEDLRRELGTKKAAKAEYPTELKIARALSLELLGNKTPLAVYSLKQFRDITDPDKACYQSLVRVPRSISKLIDVQEIEETLVVQIHDYPNLKIVETLGIEAIQLPGPATGVVYAAQGVRPLFIRCNIDEDVSQRLASRAGTNVWSLDSQVAFSTLLSDEKGSPPITADDLAEKLQDQMDPCRMTDIMFQANQRLEQRSASNPPNPAISKSAARQSLAVIDPQMVIDSILSREWGNSDDNARWRQGRKELRKAIAALPVGGETKAFAEAVMYRKFNNALAAAPGAVASTLPMVDAFQEDLDKAIAALDAMNLPNTAKNRWLIQMERIILNQEKFTRLRTALEEKVDVLAAVEILGLPELRKALHRIDKSAPEPNAGTIMELGKEFVGLLAAINALSIEGEPSEKNNLDSKVLADKSRLAELISEIAPEETLASGTSQGEKYREMVELARAYCDAQTEALLNKLSRAYQKPDFCVLRDSVGPDRDSLLPLSLSWNSDWYYGHEIDYVLDTPTPSLSPLAAPVKPDGGVNSVLEGSHA